MSKSQEPLPEEQLQLMLQRLLEIYRKNVASCDAPKVWLTDNGIEDFSLFERAGIYWADGTLPDKLPTEPAERRKFTQAGLLDPKGDERFSDCAVFPIMGLDGRHQNLWGVPKGGKARFLPNRPVGPWNAKVVKHSAHVYLVPDPVAALALLVAGYANVVALNPELGVVDVTELRSHGLQRVTVVVGDSQPDRETLQKLLGKLTGCPCDGVVLGDSFGAADFLRKNGAKALAEAVIAQRQGTTAADIPNFVPRADGLSLRSGTREYDAKGLMKVGHQLKMTLRVMCRGKVHVDTFDIYNARQRKEFVREAARIFEEQSRILEEDMARLIGACELRVAQPGLALPEQPVDPVPEALRKEAEIFGRSTDLPQQICSDLAKLGVEGEDMNKFAAYVAMTSRLMQKPLSILLKSGYGAGKNMIVGAVSQLCPPESLFDVTHASPKALLHLPTDGLTNRFMPIEEMEGAEGAAYFLRALISSGHLVARITSRDAASGKLFTESKRVKGPTSVAITTSKTVTDEETMSRFIILGLDESSAQTRRIQQRHREGQGLEGLDREKAAERIRTLHHAFQRLLQPLEVVIPDPRLIPDCDDRIGSRRDLPKMINLIKAVAFLRQMQKPVKQHGGTNYIEVDPEDLKICEPLIRALFLAPLRELSITSRNLLQLLHEMRTAGREGAEGHKFTFTMRQAREYSKYSQTTLHRCKTELELFDYVVRDTSSRQRPYRYFLEWSPESRPTGLAA